MALFPLLSITVSTTRLIISAYPLNCGKTALMYLVNMLNAAPTLSSAATNLPPSKNVTASKIS